MVYIDINRSNTHADPLLGSRWAQMWVHMWVHTLGTFLVYVTKGKTKKLHKLINNMISGKTQNPMPPNKTDEELANEFANHFLDKVEKIRSKLTTTRPHTPKAYNTQALSRFTTLTEDQLHKVIMDMPTKSCELDIISTKLLRKVLHSCIPVIMKIITGQGRL